MSELDPPKAFASGDRGAIHQFFGIGRPITLGLTTALTPY